MRALPGSRLTQFRSVLIADEQPVRLSTAIGLYPRVKWLIDDARDDSMMQCFLIEEERS